MNYHRSWIDVFALMLVAVVVFFVIMFVDGCVPAHAEPMTDRQIILAIAGEAEGLSLYEQRAIANGIINRGSLKGVYGYGRAISRTMSNTTLERARIALEQATGGDVTGGSDHWLSDWDLKHCRPSLIAWRKSMKVMLKTEHFTFYKESI